MVAMRKLPCPGDKITNGKLVSLTYSILYENGKPTVEGNHPLAGETLRVDLDIEEVLDAAREEAMELSQGRTKRVNRGARRIGHRRGESREME